MSILALSGTEAFTSSFMWSDIQVYGRGLVTYAFDVVVPRYERMKADIMISLFDAWVFPNEIIKNTRWVPWFPVDHDPIPPEVLERVRYAFDRIVFSRFGEKQMHDHNLDCHYVPHGVDTKVFAPIPDEARAIGAQKIGIPADKFVVGMVAANKGYPSRKAFEQNIAAFKMLTEKHDDALLFMQTWSGEGGQTGRDCVDLIAYCNSIGLKPGKNVLFCDQLENVTQGFPDAYMVALYNSFDVLLSVSRGEGFGIPILEAQACGTPVIVGDWTAMSELCFGGWKVSKNDATLDPTWQKSNQFIPHTEAIYERLEAAYQMRGNQDYRKRARKGAETYDVDKVVEKYWTPTLAHIAQRVETVKKLKESVSVPVKPKADIEVKEISA